MGHGDAALAGDAAQALSLLGLQRDLRSLHGLMIPVEVAVM